MKKNTKNTKKNATAKKDFDVARDVVVKKILEKIEAGNIPWNKPWFGMAKCYAYTTGRPYNCINEMMLNEEGGYVTRDQLFKLGGKMLDGETWKDRCEVVVGCFTKVKELKDADGNPILNDDGEPLTKKFQYLKYWYVVNVKYTTLPEKPRKVVGLNVEDKELAAETIIDNYVKASGVGFQNVAGDRAYYSPFGDYVVVPKIEQFRDIAEYYSTVFHELTHSTGHRTRENRFTIDSYFGNEPYAKEELVAEFGAAIINNWIGIGSATSERNSAAYIQSWAKAIKEDPHMFTYACYKADAAVNRILGEKRGAVVEDDNEGEAA